MRRRFMAKDEDLERYIDALEETVDEAVEDNIVDDEAEEGDGGIEVKDDEIMKMLITALADEWLASYQYWVCANLIRGNGRCDCMDEFKQHEKEEKDHADKIIERIKQLGGKPLTNPCEWINAGNPWTEVVSTDACEQLSITIKAEQDAIAYYQKIIDACKGVDEVTKRLARSIMADECEHLYDLQMLKEEFCG